MASHPESRTGVSRLCVSDRFIPHRQASHFDVYDLGVDELQVQNQQRDDVVTQTAAQNAPKAFGSAYVALLRAELLGLYETKRGPMTPTKTLPFHPQLMRHSRNAGDSTSAGSALFDSPSTRASSSSLPRTYCFSTPQHPHSGTPWTSPSSVASLSPDTLRMKHPEPMRTIPTRARACLDIPNISNDFYLHLIDWSKQNVLAVALGKNVHLVTPTTFTHRIFATFHEPVTSVAWNASGSHLAVGQRDGTIELWDTTTGRRVQTWYAHMQRVSSMAWNSQIVASGSRDRTIVLHDPRIHPSSYSSSNSNSNSSSSSSISSSSSSSNVATERLLAHTGEVCGLAWSPDEQQLASGGNDNKLMIWSAQKYATPLHRFAEHTAAVKAIAWSPYERGLLCSGGGTNDRCIRFWNTTTGDALAHLKTDGQVCNLYWSRACNEIVSTHGYPNNNIVCWKYPSMQPVATLSGHTDRILYLAASPCGKTIVTGAADEILRFWDLFPQQQSKLTATPTRMQPRTIR